MSSLGDWSSLGATVVSATALVGVAYQLRSQNKALEQANSATRAQVIQGINSEMLVLDRWLTENPGFVDALVSGKVTPLGNAVAETYADFMDLVFAQRGFLDDEYIGPWLEYFRELLREWPTLRRYLNDRAHWYGAMLTALAEPVAATSDEAPV